MFVKMSDRRINVTITMRPDVATELDKQARKGNLSLSRHVENVMLAHLGKKAAPKAAPAKKTTKKTARKKAA